MRRELSLTAVDEVLIVAADFLRASPRGTVVGVAAVFHEFDAVVVQCLSVPTRAVTGTAGMVRQPRVGDCGAVVHVLDSERCTVECVDGSGMTAWLADFSFAELAPPLDHWKFDVREVSAGVYRAVGSGPRNMSVESTDTDADKALADCRAFALRYRA